MPKTLTLRLDDEIYELFKSAARAENRSIANLIETAAVNRIRERQFVYDYEMAKILGDEDLLRRLCKGSSEARAGRGRFIE